MYLKLLPVNRMGSVSAFRLYSHTLANRRKTAYAGQFFLLCTFHHHNCISVVIITENHMVNITGNLLTHSF